MVSLQSTIPLKTLFVGPQMHELMQNNQIADHCVFDASFPATFETVRGTLISVSKDLRSCEDSDEEIGSVELVLAETLNNIVEHAYGESGDGQVSMTIHRTGAGLAFCITDYGRPMPNGEPPLGMQANPNAAIEDLAEGGFGWFLIRELARDLTYTRLKGANNVTFRIAVGQIAQSS